MSGSRSTPRRRRLLQAALALAVIAGVVALALPAWLARGNERVAQEVADRLGEALGADCRVDSARVLSTRSVELAGVGCVFDDGPLVGFGIGTAAAEFESAPLRGALPPVTDVTIADMNVLLRELPQVTPPVDLEDDDDALDLSVRLEREIRRLFEFTEALDSGGGGAQVPALRARLTEAGTVRVERARVDEANGDPRISDIHAVVERAGEKLSVAVAAEPARGGLVALEGTLSEGGLRDARIHLEAVPIGDLLEKAAGDGASVRAGTLSGDLRYASGDRGTWKADAALQDLDLQHDAIGSDFLPLPTIRVVGRLVPDREAEMLGVDEGRWEVAGVGGELAGSLGPLGAEARMDLRFGGEHLALGRLLGALPDSLMPTDWAEEIQGTADLQVTFGGPLHRRKEWELDWETDFSRMILASGELAREVSRLKGPFEHTFPGAGDSPPTPRTIGVDDPSFVPLRQISPHLVSAVVSTEDSGFFVHSGFEESSLKEAVLENLREGGGRGGSTITQQLAKNLFLSGERTFARKLKEAVISWRLESDLPKERILEIYLNIAEWGPGIYGAREAADHYFARTPRVLRPEEAAFLASMLPSPRRYHGYYHRGRGLTENRYTMVQDILRSMHRMGRLSAVDYHLARGEPIELAHCTAQ